MDGLSFLIFSGFLVCHSNAGLRDESLQDGRIHGQYVFAEALDMEPESGFDVG
jgi:hypothetical protein